jgi:flavin-binding protein dodecin
MSSAGAVELSSTSPVSFEDALSSGLLRARQSVRGFRDAWVRDQRLDFDGGQARFRVNLHVRFGHSDLPRDQD